LLMILKLNIDPGVPGEIRTHDPLLRRPRRDKQACDC
jgi:hypothetical protein